MSRILTVLLICCITCFAFGHEAKVNPDLSDLIDSIKSSNSRKLNHIELRVLNYGNPSLVANCAVNAGVPASFCAEDGIVLEGNTSTINIDLNSILWTILSVPPGANITIDNPSSAYSETSGTYTPGDYTFQIQATCADNDTPTQTVTHSINPLPTQANLPASQNEGCYNGTGISLSGNAPAAGESVLWKVAGGFGGVITNSTNQFAIFEPEIPDNTCLQDEYLSRLSYTIINSDGCETVDEMNIRYDYMATAFYVEAIPKNPCTLCTSLYAACQNQGLGTWTYTGPGTATFWEGVNEPNTIVCVSEVGTYTFTWTVTGGCLNGADNVDVTFSDVGYPASVYAGPSYRFCEIQPSIAMAADPPGVGQVGTWTQINGVPVSIQDVNDPSSLITGFATGGGPWWFAWEVQGSGPSGACPIVDTISIGEIPEIVWTPEDYSGCYNRYESLWESNWIPYWGFDTLEIRVTVLDEPIQRDQCTFDTGHDINLSFELQDASAGGQFGRGTCYRTIADPSTFMAIDHDGVAIHLNQRGVPQHAFCSNDLENEDFIKFKVEYNSLMFPGDYVIQFEAWDGCNTYISTETFTFISSVGTPNAGTDINLSCGTTDFELAGNSLYFGCNQANKFNWTMVSGPGPSPINNSNYQDDTPYINNLVDGAYVFRYAEILGTDPTAFCNLEYDDVQVFVSTTPPSDISVNIENTSVCAGGPAALSGEKGVNGISGQWVLVSSSPSDPNGVNFLPVNTADNVDVTGLEPNTTYTIAYEVTNMCGTASEEVNFATTANQGPDPAIIDDEVICLDQATTTTNLNAQPISVGDGMWELVSQPAGATATINSPSSSSTTVQGLNICGAYVMVWQTSNSGCPTVSTDTVKIAKCNPTQPNAGSDIDICNALDFPYNVSLSANAITIGSGAWSQISGPSVVTFSDNTDPSADVTLPIIGTYVLIWTADFYGCSELQDFITIEVGGAPFAHAGPDQSRCGGSNVFTLDALDIPAGSGNGVWSINSVSGTPGASFANVSDPNTSITFLNGGVVELKWSTFSADVENPCPAKSDLIIIEYVKDADAGLDQKLCEASSATLNGNIPEDESTIAWTQVSGPNSATIGSPTNYFTSVSNLVAGTYVFRYSKRNPACPNSSDDVTIEIGSMPTLPDAGGDESLCVHPFTNEFSLNGVAPPSGTIAFWDLAQEPAGSNASISNVNDPNALVSNLAAGTYVFRWYYENEFCQYFDEVIYEIETVGCCLIDIVDTDINCDDNNTPTFSNDDVFYVDLTINAQSGSSWTMGIYSGSYGVTQTIGPFVIANGDLNFTIQDASNPTCQYELVISPPPTCSNAIPCDITSITITDACDDNGTPTDPNDDTFTFELTANATGGTTWTGGGQSGSYAVPTSFGPFAISGGNISFTITDSADPSCTHEVDVTPPMPCSNEVDCDITNALISKSCDDNGTPTNPNDDQWSFTLTALNNGGTSWTGGGSGGNYGSAVNFGPYAINAGNQSFTIVDDDNPTCSYLVDASPPSDCSNQEACSIDSYTVTNINCDDNGTSEDPEDDTFTFTINVVGEGPGWSGGGLVGSFNSPTVMGPYEIYCGDLNFQFETQCNNDVLNVNIIAPPACSFDPDCSFVYASLTSNNCCSSCDGNIILNTIYDDTYDVSPASNVAEFKPTNVSSTASAVSSNSGFPVDNIAFNSLTTGFEENPWWEIDLMGQYDLSQLIMTGLNGGSYTVLVRTTPFTSYDLTAASSGATSYNTNTGTLALSGQGRFIRIYKNGIGQMTLDEVQILATSNPTTNPFSFSWDIPSVGNVQNPTCVDPGNYNVTVTDNVTNCESILSVTVE